MADSGDQLLATAQIDSGTTGDVVAYAFYQSTSGELVMGAPVVVYSDDPDGASMVGISVVPGDLGGTVGQSVEPELWVEYSDGTTLQRYFTAEDITVTSSSGQIVDVSTSTAVAVRRLRRCHCGLHMERPSCKLTIGDWGANLYSRSRTFDQYCCWRGSAYLASRNFGCRTLVIGKPAGLGEGRNRC